MGSNVFKFPGAGIFTSPSRQTSIEAACVSASVSFFPALTVTSFRRRPPPSLKLTASSHPQGALSARHRADLRLVELQGVEGKSTGHLQSLPPSPPQPLRVLRLLEDGQPPGIAGRLRLSGRLADVCAELDRMAAAEPGTGSHALRA